MVTFRRAGQGVVPYAVLCAILVAGIGSAAHAANWWESVKVKGDLRYRHEMIDEADKDARHRQRLRARIGITGTASEYAKVGVQLASGSDDPVSTNQTLDGGFSTKSIGLDLAYFELSHPKFPGVEVIAGKMKNPFVRPGGTELIWDSDLNPEGGALTWTRKHDKLTLQAAGGGFWIDERSSTEDSWLGAVQGMGSVKLNDKSASLAVGGGFYSVTNAKGFAPFYDPDDSFGNSLMPVVSGTDTVMAYANGFSMLELFAELNHELGTTPVSVFGHFVTNGDADSLESGWLVGFTAGSAKKAGQWEVRYNYRELKRDAVLGAFTDSDFRGGGTDAKGHEIGGELALATNMWFGATYFVNELGISADETEDFNRLQLDLQLKF